MALSWKTEGWRRLVAAVTGRRFLWLLCALLALLCLAVAARLALLTLGDARQPTVRFPAVAGADSARDFAVYPGDGSPSSNGEDLAVARIDAVLLGVLGRGERALASIALEGERDRIYAEGDRLAPGVEVERILPRAVIVREQGQRRRIPLKSLVDDGGPLIERAGAGPASEPPSPRGVGLSPAITGDGATGLRVERLDPALADLAGVEQGDLVVAVEGRPVATLMDDREALAQLAGSDSLAVTVLRDGREQELSLDGRLLREWLRNGPGTHDTD